VIKIRCIPVSLVLFVAVAAFLAAPGSAEAGGPVAGAGSNQISSPRVGGVGTLAINPAPDTCNPATSPSCAFYDVCVKEAPANDLNNPSCSANDVQLTELVEGSLEVLPDLDGGIGCDGLADAADPQCPWGGDCVTFTAIGHYVLTSQTRYDIGTFLALFPSGVGQNGAVSGECLRFAYTNSDTVALDNDTCGDLDQAHGGVTTGGIDIAFGPVTVPCVADDNGNIVINHCETWSQRNNEIICNGADDVLAGTGSKCNCGVLSGICIAVNSGDACVANVCQGTCQNSTGGGSGTECQSSADCTVTGETCRDITLVEQPVQCPDQSDTDCSNPDTCVDGACQPNNESDGTPCIGDNNQCTIDQCVNGQCVAGAGGSQEVPEP
jgi:hypothetical protein